MLRAIKNGNAILVFDYWLLAWFIGILIQHFRGTDWSFWFWVFYLSLWFFIPVVVAIIVASIALAYEERALRYSE